MQKVWFYFVSIMYCRVRAYIENGWADTLIDPDGTTTSGTDTSASNPVNDNAIFLQDLNNT